jgi:hypothetical protein
MAAVMCLILLCDFTNRRSQQGVQDIEDPRTLHRMMEAFELGRRYLISNFPGTSTEDDFRVARLARLAIRVRWVLCWSFKIEVQRKTRCSNHLRLSP